MSRRDDLECKLYVGDLPKDVQERELEKAFNYYGPIKKVWVAKNPPGFAFVEFEDPRDADDAVRALDGTTICGSRARVEHSTGKIRPKPWLRGPPGGGRGGFDPDDRCYKCGERGHYAYDCRRSGGASGGSRRRSRSRSHERRRSRSRSRSPDRRRRSRSRSPRRSRSRSPYRRTRSRTRSPFRRSRDRSRSRSRSPAKNGS